MERPSKTFFVASLICAIACLVDRIQIRDNSKLRILIRIRIPLTSTGLWHQTRTSIRESEEKFFFLMAVPLNREGGGLAINENITHFFSDGEVPTFFKLEGGGGG